MLLRCKITKINNINNSVDCVAISSGRAFKNIKLFSASCQTATASINQEIFLIFDCIGLLLSAVDIASVNNVVAADDLLIGSDSVSKFIQNQLSINKDLKSDIAAIKLKLKTLGVVF